MKAGTGGKKNTMSVEVEIKLKIREGGMVSMQNALNSQGFVTGDTVIESDLYYTSTHHDFIRLDEALRVRTIETLRNGTVESVSSVLTYKGPKLDQRSMARKELETPVGNAAICDEILRNIGFSPVPPVQKKRQHFLKEDVTACIDSVEELGDYLELEIIVPSESQREAALKKIETLLLYLGYSMSDTTRISYLSMLMQQS